MIAIQIIMSWKNTLVTQIGPFVPKDRWKRKQQTSKKWCGHLWTCRPLYLEAPANLFFEGQDALVHRRHRIQRSSNLKRLAGQYRVNPFQMFQRDPDTVTPSGGGDVVVAALGPRVRRWWGRTLLPPWDEWPDPKRWTGLQEKVWQAHVPRKLKLQLKKRQETTAWRSPELCTLTAFPWRMLDCCVCERALPKQFFQYFHFLHHGPSEQPQFPLDFNLSEIRTSTGTYRSMMYGPIGNFYRIKMD